MNQQGTEKQSGDTYLLALGAGISLTLWYLSKLNLTVYRLRGEAASGNLMLCGSSV